MPCPLYQRYLQFSMDAQSQTCEDYRDLPSLLCDSCNKSVHFGGAEWFLEQEYTMHDVCSCCVVDDGTEG